MTIRVFITYISPNGSTGKVAAVLADQLTRGGATVCLADLADAAQSRALIQDMTTKEKPVLFIGSPVYRDVAVPPVMAFIKALPPQGDNAWAVPFVTYGRACSGIALWQMATTLQQSGFQLAGAAKVVAVHSMMWQADTPEGSGHPDADDLFQVKSLANSLLSQFAAGTPAPLPLKALDYQPQERAVEFKAKLEKPWMVVPKTVDDNACTECGVCADQCPAAAITLTPLPEFGAACFDCFNCIRLCPEKAISPPVPMATVEANIRERVKNINEQPLTRIFSSFKLDR